MLILDTDAASVLAKGELLEETLELFEDVYITPKVEAELERPIEYGYKYPENIFNTIDTLNVRKEEKKNYREWFDTPTVDKGEIEAIALAENRDTVFFTLDKKAKEFAEEKGVQNISFNNLVKIFYKRNIATEYKLENSIKMIEEKDNRKINKKEILGGLRK